MEDKSHLIFACLGKKSLVRELAMLALVVTPRVVLLVPLHSLVVLDRRTTINVEP